MDSIETIRKKINDIDREIAKLYEERMELMKDVAQFKIENKKPILDLEREKKVIQNNSSYINNPDLRPLYVEFIQFIMDQGKSIQENIVENKKDE